MPLLFGPIFAAGWRIRFAHRTFSWDSDAPGKASVHCVIVGFDRAHEPRPQLWDYPNVSSAPVAVPVERVINAYLVDGPNVLVQKMTSPISCEIKPAVLGAMAKDGGGLIVEAQDVQEALDDPIAAKYLRPYVGSRELVRGLSRWCLWMVDLDPADVQASTFLRSRIEQVRAYRTTSSAPTTRSMAKIPHLFAQRYRPQTDFLCVPSVVSENRPYFTAADIEEGTVVSSLAFAVEDSDRSQFALISSSMFITWQKMIGGRLESRLRFANTLTWNTFPVPELDEKTRKRIIKAGQKVLAARALHPERSLAEHYNPLAMTPELVKAHDALDREVDKAMGAARKLTSERQRQELLFANYAKLTNN